MVNIKSFVFNPFGECCSIVWKDIPVQDGQTSDGIIIDPGFYDNDERSAMMDFVNAHRIRPTKILLTHGHFDHIFGVKECLRAYGDIPVYMDGADGVILKNDHLMTEAYGLKSPDVDFRTVDVKEGDRIGLGDGKGEDETAFEVISTPGHTPGGVCYYDKADHLLFSGDTLFAGSIGRTDSQWGDYDQLIKGILDKLIVLDGDTAVIPGHGPKTTIVEERTSNPFLQPFNEPETDWEHLEGIEIHGPERQGRSGQ